MTTLLLEDLNPETTLGDLAQAFLGRTARLVWRPTGQKAGKSAFARDALILQAMAHPGLVGMLHRPDGVERVEAGPPSSYCLVPYP